MLRAHGMGLVQTRHHRCLRTARRPCGEERGRQSRLEEQEAAACTGVLTTVHEAGVQEAVAGGNGLQREKGLAETVGGTDPEKEEGDEGCVRQALSSSASRTFVNDRRGERQRTRTRTHLK